MEQGRAASGRGYAPAGRRPAGVGGRAPPPLPEAEALAAAFPPLALPDRRRPARAPAWAPAPGRRAVRSLVSPAGLLGAAALGFLAVTGVTRRHQYQPAPVAARRGKLAGIMSVVASAAFALLRAQFGSPAQMAQLVLSKLKR